MVDDLVFQDNDEKPRVTEPANDWMYVKLRYKLPDAQESELLTVMAGVADYTKNPDDDFRFASAAAELALLLKGSEYAGDANFASLIERAKGAKGVDEDGYRAEFIRLAQHASLIDR